MNYLRKYELLVQPEPTSELAELVTVLAYSAEDALVMIKKNKRECVVSVRCSGDRGWPGVR